jgi:hypothetical membrane protein
MMSRKALLACGVLSAVLYILADVIAALLYPGYSYTGQTISELFAIGAPTRTLVLSLFIARSLLQVVFGLGVWMSFRALRTAAVLLIALATWDLTAAPFFPMHQRSVLAAGGGTLTDTLHIAGAAVDVLLILFILGFAINAFRNASRKLFRFYSIATVIVLLLFGALAGLDGPRVSADLPTPWVGVTERICVYSFMVWMAIFALVLLRAPNTAEAQ